MSLETSAIKKVIVLFVFVLVVGFLSKNVSASTISGIVYDNQRNPLVEVDIELQDDFYRMIARTKTNGTGRYEFGGLRNGRFNVRVMPFRLDFIEQSITVEIDAINSIPNQDANQFVTQDFYLLPKKGSLTETESSVVFVQEIPNEAKRVYESALKDFSRKRSDDGVTGLRKAIEIFPTYYLALYRLGKEMYAKGEYGEALQIFIKASDVNPNSPTNYYYMGYSLVKLNYTKAALIPLKKALELAPNSFQVLFVLGTTEVSEGKYAEAEKHLLQAEKLSKADLAEIHWELAQLYGNNMKKYKEAADELELYLKAGKFDEQYSVKIKKLIEGFRKRAAG